MRFAETAKYGTTRRKIQQRAENHIFSNASNVTPSKYSLKSPNNGGFMSLGPTYRGSTPNKTQRVRTIDHNNTMYNTQINFAQGAQTRVDLNNTTVASSGGRKILSQDYELTNNTYENKQQQFTFREHSNKKTINFLAKNYNLQK